MIQALFLAVSAMCATPAFTEVEVVEKDGEIVCTVHARHVPIDELMRQIGRESGRTIEGLAELREYPEVEIDLVERPIDLVVERVCGAAGLRAQVKSKSITVKSDLDGSATTDELIDMADVMFVRALRHFPEAPQAAEAEFLLGDIQERRKNQGAARTHYDTLIRAFPESPFYIEALMRTGTILSRLGSWRDAATYWSRVANHPPPNSYAVFARVELARSLAMSGDGRQALTMIDALDQTAPPVNLAERADRMYVRAAALVAAGNGKEGLETLEEAMKAGLDQSVTVDAARLRADALDHADRPTEASRAWLAFARTCEDDRKKDAYVRAAQSAEKAGDLLGILFIERTAVGSGAEARIRPIADAARTTLGLEEHDEESLIERLSRAETQCDESAFTLAASLIENVWRDRARLGESDLVRAALVRSRCVEAADGIAPAIEVLKNALPEIKRPEGRRRIYLLAGELYEKRSQWDLAAQAYGGRL
ncbi:MAG: tetratricopeptide repeat protein [Planctomycetota bacterium]|nr:tetratricopeptide repeat protein [Planctomycetota bacterium]